MITTCDHSSHTPDSWNPAWQVFTQSAVNLFGFGVGSGTEIPYDLMLPWYLRQTLTRPWKIAPILMIDVSWWVANIPYHCWIVVPLIGSVQFKQSLIHMFLWPNCCKKRHGDTIRFYSCIYRVWHSHCSSFPMVFGHSSGNSTCLQSSTNVSFSRAMFVEWSVFPIHIPMFVMCVCENHDKIQNPINWLVFPFISPCLSCL